MQKNSTIAISLPYTYLWLGLLLLLLAGCRDQPGIDFEATRIENHSSKYLDQYQNSDSLIAIVKTYKSNRRQIDSLLYWTEILTTYNDVTALEYANEAHRVSTIYNKKFSQAISKYYRATLKQENAIYGENSENAVADARNSRRLLEKMNHPEWQIKVNNLLAGLYNKQQVYDSAKYYLTESLQILSNTQLPGDLPYNLRGQTLHLFANVYSMTDSTRDQALQYYNDALNLYTQSNNQKRILDLYSGLGLLYMNQGQYTKADSLFKKSETLAIALNEKSDLANIYNNLGLLKLSQWRAESSNDTDYFEKATGYLRKGIRLQSENFYYPYALMGYAFHSKWNQLPAKENQSNLDSAIIFYSYASNEASKEANLAYTWTAIDNIYKLCDRRYSLFGLSCDSLLKNTKINFIHQSYDTLVQTNKRGLNLAVKTITVFEKKEQEAINGSRIRNTRLISIFAFIVAVFIFLLVLQRQQQKRLQARMAALRAQINPHFMSNSLNAIESLVNQDQKQAASKYLIHFSRLTRRLLDSSRSPQISLQEELKTLEHFLALEQLRFRDKLHYEVEIEPGLDPESVEVPALILQPYLENAILHGIKPKTGPGNLLIQAKRVENKLVLTVEDDGIGRKKAQELKEKSVFKPQSHGQNITEERIRIFGRAKGAKVKIEDLYQEDGSAAGTRIIIRLPWKQRP